MRVNNKEIWWCIVYINYDTRRKEPVGYEQALIFRKKKHALRYYQNAGYSKIDNRESRQKCGWIIKKIELKLIN